MSDFPLTPKPQPEKHRAVMPNTFGSNTKCRSCGLPFCNPVHATTDLLQMALDDLVTTQNKETK